MTHRHDHTCPVAEVLNIFGDHWTWLVIREAFYGATRFSQVQRNTGIARNLLSDRLRVLVSEGILETQNVSASGVRLAYRLTAKGQSLHTLLLAMSQWGNAHVYGAENAPAFIIDRRTGRQIPQIAVRGEDGEILRPDDIEIRPGPGASEATRKRLAEAASCMDGPTRETTS